GRKISIPVDGLDLAEHLRLWYFGPWLKRGSSHEEVRFLIGVGRGIPPGPWKQNLSVVNQAHAQLVLQGKDEELASLNSKEALYQELAEYFKGLEAELKVSADSKQDEIDRKVFFSDLVSDLDRRLDLKN